MRPLVTLALRLGAGLVGAALAAPPASAQYTYGRFLEPPEGTVLQGMGQFWGAGEDNPQYLGALAPYGESVLPGHDMVIVNISPVDVKHGHFGPFDAQAQLELYARLKASAAAQRVPHVAISFYNYSVPFAPGLGLYKPTAHDIEVAIDVAPQHDFMMSQITRVGQVLAAFGRPVFVRIGLEINNLSVVDGAEGYHPFFFPIAYRKTVETLKAAGATHSAYIWCWFASAPTTYADVDAATGAAKWYPGDQYVDWFGLDLFNRNQFTTLTAPSYPQAPSQLADVEKFLAVADQHSRPVFVGESSCVDFDIVAGDANGAWTGWFTHYFEFLAAHPSIKAITYISHDWTGGSGGAPEWKDGRIANSTQVTAAWAEEIGRAPFIGRGSGPMLNGYDGWWGLGHALDGAMGAPLLRGYGPLKAGEQVTIELTNAKPSAIVAVYVGFSRIDAPFMGGVMVPHPDIVVVGPHTDAMGTLTLTTSVPQDVPSGIKSYYQCWIADATQPLGLAASNALMGETQ
jgi:hypothetical protein